MAVVMVWVNVWKEDCSKLARRQGKYLVGEACSLPR